MKRLALVFMVLSTTIACAQVAVVVPTQVNFGQVLVGQTSPTQLVTLKNTGVDQLTVTSIAISGNFALPKNTCANGVKPGTHCNVYVTFTPHALETETGTLSFTDNTSTSPQVVTLTGTGSNVAATKTTITASTQKILAGTPITFTVTVASLGGGVIPDGDQVSLSSPAGYNTYGSGTLLGGVAVITTSELGWDGPRPGGGDVVVTAVYAGDQSFSGSRSPKLDVAIDRWPTTGYVTITPNPSQYCQPIMFTPYITSSGPNAPTGTVFFIQFMPKIYAVNIGETETFDGCSFGGSNVVYEGDLYNDWTTKITWNQTVNPSPTTTTITSLKNPSTLGKVVEFKVRVTQPWGHNVKGSVTFTTGPTTLGTVQLSAGECGIKVSSLPEGQNTITATYAPGENNFLSSSTSLVQTVQ